MKSSNLSHYLIAALLTITTTFTTSAIASTTNTNAALVDSLSGYWQNFTNPAETPVKLTSIPTQYDIVPVAFADLSSDGTVSFTLQGPPYQATPDSIATFKKDIKALQDKKIKVLISLGGQNGAYQVNSQQQNRKFIDTLKQVIETYGFNGVDYDFEHGLTVENSRYLVEATQELKNYFKSKGKEFFVTIAPETLDVYFQYFSNGKYDKLIQAHLVDRVQVQLYNSGCMPGINGPACYVQGSKDFIVSQADSTIQVWMKHGIKNAAEKYVAGLPATIQAAGGGYVEPAVINEAMQCLQTKQKCDSYVPTQAYPMLKKVMTWDINWDAKENYKFVKTVRG
ncbi:MAG TPA: glycosyl hydrolase family 18 protein [Gammaproteobacteria bacterium]|nr:glycosyl hydrolase family 18 protein [Gammaproteobacteria bacterium]